MKQLACLLVALPLLGQPQSEKASLEGMVTNAVTGGPVRHARVILRQSGRVPAVAEAETDGSGSFTITELPPGTYRVSALHSNYPQPGNRPASAAVVVAAGERRKGVTLSLLPPGTISGRLTDENEDPLALCEVTAYRPNPRTKGELMAVLSSTTTDSGEFRLIQLPAGRYYLQFACSWHPEVPEPLHPADQVVSGIGDVFEPCFYPGVRSLADAQMVQLPPGSEVQGLQLTVRRRTAYPVRGRVSRPAGVARVWLLLRPAEQVAVPEQGSLRTSADPRTGAFEFDNALPGSYVIEASSGGGQQNYLGTGRVEVKDRIPEPVEVAMRPSLPITGRIKWETESEANQRQIANLLINYLWKSQGGNSGASSAGLTPDGQFTLVRPPSTSEGRIEVANLTGPRYVKSIKRGVDELTSNGIQGDESSGEPLEILISDKGATVSGLVQSESDQNIVSVVLRPLPDTRFYQTGPFERQLEPSERFQFTGVPPGRYRLYAIEGEYSVSADGTDLLDQLESSTEVFEIAEGQKLERNPTVQRRPRQ